MMDMLRFVVVFVAMLIVAIVISVGYFWIHPIGREG